MHGQMFNVEKDKKHFGIKSGAQLTHDYKVSVKPADKLELGVQSKTGRMAVRPGTQ